MDAKVFLKTALPMDQIYVTFAMNAIVCAFAGVVGGVVLGAVLCLLEYFWYYTLLYFEKKKLIRRLAPSVDVKSNKYTLTSFLAVSVAAIPLIVLVFTCRKKYLESAFISVDVIGAWKFCWITMVLHDAFFWFVHTVIHHFKSLYKLIHQRHHSTGGDITVFSTAYGEISDIALTFTPFYCALSVWLYSRPAWNMFHVLILGWTVNSVNMMGHCGYDLPMWIYVPGSFGVLLTPLAQRPLHHFIHHLDPRSNRSLYFTWWDRMGGTFRKTHPRIPQS